MFWTALSTVQRRALLTGGVVVMTTGAFAAGALAMRGDDPGRSQVDVETVGAALASSTTVVETTTVPKTTTVPQTTTTSPPPSPTTTTKAKPPAPPPPPPPPPPQTTYTFEAPGAGTMTVKLEGGVLTVVAVTPLAGWAPETLTGSGAEYVKVVFRQGNVVKWVKARLTDGEVKPETGEWTECDTSPPAGTATYELPGVGSVTVTWNGTAFTLDAATPEAGWAVVSQETPGDYVRVSFGPASEPSAQTGGDGDGTRWIKVKILECQIEYVTN